GPLHFVQDDETVLIACEATQFAFAPRVSRTHFPSALTLRLHRHDEVGFARRLLMPTVDFYFDFSSTNSYFAAFLLPQICDRAGAQIAWMPLHCAALFRGTGFDVMAMTPRKARYLWRDHARYSELTGLPFKRPSRFPIKTALALRCVLAAD